MPTKKPDFCRTLLAELVGLECLIQNETNEKETDNAVRWLP